MQNAKYHSLRPKMLAGFALQRGRGSPLVEKVKGIILVIRKKVCMKPSI